ALYPILGYRSVALGTSVGAVLNAAFLFAIFQRRFGGLTGHGLASSVGRMLAATAMMGAAAWWTLARLEATMGVASLRAELSTVFLPVGAGVLVYALAAYLLHIPEMGTLLAAMRSRRTPRS